jgi:uncharacterized protein YjiS (DUF1127 family)
MNIYDSATFGNRTSANRLGGLLGSVSTRVAQYRTYRRTLDELRSLTDRELTDLGISRHSLRAIAYSAAYDG